MTALHLAVYANEHDCVGILLKSGAVPNAVDNVGKTALHDAAYGYAVSLISSPKIYTLLWKILLSIFSGFTQCVEVLADGGADLNAVEIEGNTPVHRAIEGSGLEPVVSILLRKKADMEAKDKKGNTPLLKAVMYNRPGVVEILLRVSES